MKYLTTSAKLHWKLPGNGDLQVGGSQFPHGRRADLLHLCIWGLLAGLQHDARCTSRKEVKPQMPAANLLHHRALFHLSASPFPTYKMELVFITQNCKNCSQWLFLAVGLGCKAPVAEVTAGPGGHSNPQMAPGHICGTAQAFLHASAATLPHQAQTRNVSHFVPSLRTNTSLQA